MTRLANENPLISATTEEERLKRVEEQVRLLENRFFNTFLQGRIRFDRTVPVNSADVQTPDRLYDRVLSPTAEYILINNAGTLAWRKIIMSAF